jgi:hypothetical protein
VTNVCAIEAAHAPHRTIPGGDYDGLALRRNDHSRCALRSGSLFDQDEFSTLVVFALPTECKDRLKGEEELPVKVLMQAVKIACPIAQ